MCPGAILNEDPYGFAIPKNHPLYEQLKNAMIVVNQARPVQKLRLKKKWFDSDPSSPAFVEAGSSGFYVGVVWLWLPPFLTLLSVGLSFGFYRKNSAGIDANIEQLAADYRTGHKETARNHNSKPNILTESQPAFECTL